MKCDVIKENRKEREVPQGKVGKWKKEWIKKSWEGKLNSNKDKFGHSKKKYFSVYTENDSLVQKQKVMSCELRSYQMSNIYVPLSKMTPMLWESQQQSEASHQTFSTDWK